MTCPSLERLAAWFLREQEQADAELLEQHLFDCDRCAARAEKMEALVAHLRAALPPLLTPERRRALERAEVPPTVSLVVPGAAAKLVLRKGAEIGFWVLQQDFSGVRRVDCELFTTDGSTLASFPDVPFDAERKEVVLACQLHYRELSPPDIVARLTSFDDAGGRRTAEYRLHHEFREGDV